MIAKSLRYRNKDPPAVRLDTELVFCHTDFNDENYLFDTHDGRLRLYMIDFEQSSFLPIDFLAYVVLMDGRWALCKRLRNFLVFPDKCHTNMPLLREIAGIFATYVRGVGLLPSQR